MPLQKPPRWKNWSQPRRRRWRQFQQEKKTHLPMTPGFEAGQRMLDEQLTKGMADIAYQRGRIPEMVGLQHSRLRGQQKEQTRGLDESMVERGIYDSSVRPYLRQRDIDRPIGRELQDLGIQASEALSQLGMQEGDLNLAYRQGLADLWLQRAQEALESGTLGLSRFKTKRKKKKKGKK